MADEGMEGPGKYDYIQSHYTDEEVELICKVAHSVSQAIAEAFGLRKLSAWEQTHIWYRMSFTKHIEDYLNTGADCRKLHKRWVIKMGMLGWTLGEYDKENKTRPDLVDFNDLPIEQRLRAKQIRAAVIPFRKHDIHGVRK